jgi:hypothetical protein
MQEASLAQRSPGDTFAPPDDGKSPRTGGGPMSYDGGMERSG